MTLQKRLSAPVPPGGTIGILGGGQLGRMLAMAAAQLGLKAHIYSDEENAPAFQVSNGATTGTYDDSAALRRFAAACDAVTFEFENVPAETAVVLAGHVPVNPSPRILAIMQERFEEKSFLAKLDLKTARFFAVNSPAEANDALLQLNGAGVLKTRRMGYDGKGQAKVANAQDVTAAFNKLGNAPLILEEFVDFAFEASIVAARGADGSFAAYDPAENVHEHHILRRSTVPATLSAGQCEDAKDIAHRIADALDYVGVLGVELFVMRNGELLVNEIAPRVHNSGHWTMDACLVSQFEQHIRAVAGWPLSDPSRHSNAVMENIIGSEAEDWRTLAAKGGALHLYGKSQARPGRKMGHITWLTPRSDRV